MKKIKINNLPLADTNRVVGLSGANASLTDVVQSKRLPNITTATYRKILDITSSGALITLLISGGSYTNVKNSTYIISITMTTNIFINTTKLAENGIAGGMIIKYKIEGNNLRIWVQGGINGAPINVICLTSNYQPIFVEDTPAADAVTVSS